MTRFDKIEQIFTSFYNNQLDSVRFYKSLQQNQILFSEASLLTRHRVNAWKKKRGVATEKVKTTSIISLYEKSLCLGEETILLPQDETKYLHGF